MDHIFDVMTGLQIEEEKVLSFKFFTRDVQFGLLVKKLSQQFILSAGTVIRC